MNNPFLSDRNIFSKVVNPLKKKSETDKKEEGKPAEAPLLSKVPDKPREVTANNYNPYKNDRPAEELIAPKSNPFSSQSQKMTFGVPNDPGKRPQKQYFSKPYEQEESESETHEIYNYNKGDTIKFPLQNDSNAFESQKEKKAMASRRNEILSPPQDYKFEEYRKTNNLTDCSPINPQPRMGDSEFLNIDALGDDLNRFLAQSKNQDELCKILGIERTNKRQQINERPSERIQNSRNYGQRQRAKNPFENKVQLAPRTVQAYQSKQSNQESQQTLPKVPAIFSKQRKVENARTDQYVPAPKQQQQQPLKSSSDHIPTFNYVGLDQENSTISREDEDPPNFNSIKLPNKPKANIQASKASQSSQVEPLEVFNYSKVVPAKNGDSLQGIIEKEMMELSINGKYRTFLSASEKIVTVRYKMEAL